MNEFDLIATYFAPLAGPGALGLKDDAALIRPPDGEELVITMDTLVAGVHFLEGDPAGLIARKALRVNLSDLAAKGAWPFGYLLSLSLPAEIDETWLADFAGGLGADQTEFGIVLWGGDTTSTPGPLTISITALGTVPTGKMLRRDGAQPGDVVWVTGTIGDAALGLNSIRSDGSDAFLADRYRLPRPRVAMGEALRGVASASADISDGLIADLGHICAASGVGAVIRADEIPLSPSVQTLVKADPDVLTQVLAGGDDYELIFTSHPDMRSQIADRGRLLGINAVEIGEITAKPAGAPVRVLRGGKEFQVSKTGYVHF